ncbi:MAG TPA: hypothetical protein VHE79_05180 [Spirochaetia bacterium]
MRGLAVTLLFFVAVSSASGQSFDQVSVRPWVELEPLFRIDPSRYPLPLDVAERDLLETGRVLVSGMVFGWTFEYYPGDRARQVQESFTLTPIAEIPWGSPRLRVSETEHDATRLWGRIIYSLSDEDSRRRSSWESNTADQATGTGTAPIQAGPDGRDASLKAAIRDAIRRSLDTRYVNKPRSIRGEVILWDDPQTIVRSGTYTTVAKVRIAVRELVPYRIF